MQNFYIICIGHVFLTFPRKTLINGQYCCTQLEPLINQVKDRCWILENPFWLEDKSYRVSHFSEKQKNMTYTDNIEILHRLRMPFLIMYVLKNMPLCFIRKF